MKVYFYFILFFVLSLFVISPAFDTIDDCLMLQIVSGQYGHYPSEFMLYSSVFYGKVLVALYKLVPAFNWYYFIFIISHLVSWLVILNSILKINLKNKVFGISLFFVVFLTFGLYFLGNLQFTTTSFLLGFSGFLLIINSKNKKLIFTGILMVFLASLIRFYSVLLLCWLLMPYMFYRWVLNDGFKNILHYKYQIGLILLLSVAVFFIRDSGRNQYLKDEHANLLGEFIIERGKLIDNPNFIYSEENKAVFLDIDKTIIPNGSLHLLVQHLYKKKLIPLSLIFRVLYWYSLYKMNWINDFSKVIEKSNQLLGSFLDVYSIKQLTNLLEDWFNNEIKQLIYPELKNKIEELYNQGYKIFFVTSTIQPVANLFKNYFGFGLVISTEIEEKDGYYTGYPTNKPCHGKEKLERIKLLQKEY
ncbi:haloacid dehalogenase-like hydrolase, partial [bacterium]|nr:haloacid dehalogenase-like hydrolase [bacterium]